MSGLTYVGMDVYQATTVVAVTNADVLMSSSRIVRTILNANCR
jgi:hypothetical protein